MTPLKFTVAFDGIDIEDLDLLDRLAEDLPNVHWGEVDGEVQADVFVRGLPLTEAVTHVVETIRTIAPTAQAIRALEDFVAIPDIARRTDVTREAARLWSKEASFPPPRGVVGNGIKIWDWAAVNSWLRREHAGALGDPYRHPSPAELAQANTLLRQIHVHQSLLVSEFEARPHAPTGSWEPISAIDIPATAALRSREPVQAEAHGEAMAG